MHVATAHRNAPSTARLVRNAGTVAGLTAMMTNYEAGVVRVMPMRGHLALDFIMCTALLLSPLDLPRLNDGGQPCP